MIHCPDCGGEFVAGVGFCNACGSSLVEGSPVHPSVVDPSAVVEWVDLETYREPVQARLAAEYLHANGIEVRLNGEHTIDTLWLLSDLLGGVRISVAREHAEAAHEVLSSMTAPIDDTDAPSEFAGGQVDTATVEESRAANRGKVLVTMLLSYPLSFLLGMLGLLGRRDSSGE
ncbi:MAG: DUF2007 domain-containing protein [Thermoanaerobaculia bacterium]|nr:DUF2007 domain-containing protein [Thermoanaerobaculia bacterium]